MDNLVAILQVGVLAFNGDECLLEHSGIDTVSGTCRDAPLWSELSCVAATGD
ncbi:MAG: hypothetical protein ACFBSF_22590 [Leptolyngbyaceae cyanobacterium]